MPAASTGGPAEPLKTYYLDGDKDGYGNPAVSMKSTWQHVGYVANNTDCDDSNANVNPGVKVGSNIRRSNGSFDYDCSGTSTPTVGIGSCVPTWGNPVLPYGAEHIGPCTYKPGYDYNNPVLACGEVGVFVSGCHADYATDTCVAHYTPHAMECR